MIDGRRLADSAMRDGDVALAVQFYDAVTEMISKGTEDQGAFRPGLRGAGAPDALMQVGLLLLDGLLAIVCGELRQRRIEAFIVSSMRIQQFMLVMEYDEDVMNHLAPQNNSTILHAAIVYDNYDDANCMAATLDQLIAELEACDDSFMAHDAAVLKRHIAAGNRPFS